MKEQIEITIDFRDGIKQTITTDIPCGISEYDFCRRYIRKLYGKLHKGKHLRFSWWIGSDHGFGDVYCVEPAF